MNVLSLTSDAVQFLAEEPARGPEFGKASPWGLLIIIVLLIAVFLLIRSMNKQLKKLPETFDADQPQADQAFDEGTDRVDGATRRNPKTSDQSPNPASDGPDDGGPAERG
ncbi:hypothetical protein [Gordonia sp. (in: high G+C Gram-positive bacteria)]|uniref:hypothetical protein n=1 Tax=Gordonia sp. (in: high G+C Gram-positive bacteria) TaxID=84139 RepID=UPI003C752DF6